MPILSSLGSTPITCDKYTGPDNILDFVMVKRSQKVHTGHPLDILFLQNMQGSGIGGRRWGGYCAPSACGLLGLCDMNEYMDSSQGFLKWELSI